MDKDKENEWVVNGINIDRINYGDNEGNYTCKISFRNGKRESFTTCLPSDKTKLMLSLISDIVKQNASDLAEKINKTL